MATYLSGKREEYFLTLRIVRGNGGAIDPEDADVIPILATFGQEVWGNRENGAATTRAFQDWLGGAKAVDDDDKTAYNNFNEALAIAQHDLEPAVKMAHS